MPIKWTAELDSILLHVVFEECNISFTKALYEKIDGRVTDTGMVCTAKAVKNRLYNWKKKNVSGDTGLNNSTTDTPLKISATPRTPRTKFKSMTKKRKSGESDSGLDDPANDDEDIKSPSTGRGKIGLHGTPFIYVSQESESEDTVAHKAKRVKTEPVDEDDSFEDPAYHAAYDHEAQRV